MKDNKIKKLIGDRIRFIRKDVCEMVQLDFAKTIGIATQAAISEYERGFRIPSLRVCNNIIKVAAKHKHPIKLEWLRPDIYQ